MCRLGDRIEHLQFCYWLIVGMVRRRSTGEGQVFLLLDPSSDPVLEKDDHVLFVQEFLLLEPSRRVIVGIALSMALVLSPAV